MIIDTSPAAGSSDAAAALMLADRVMMPARSDRASIDGVVHVLEAALRHNVDARPLGVILFGSDRRATCEEREARAELADALGDSIPVCAVSIRSARRAQTATRNAGLTAVEAAAAPGAAGNAGALAGDYAALWDELESML